MTLPRFVLALALSAAPQQAAPTAPPPSAAPASANITFHSDVLHLDYVYPSSFESKKDDVDSSVKQQRDKSEGAVKQAMGCMTVPITGVDKANGLRMIIMVRLDGTCLGTELPASSLGYLATQFITGTLSQFGEPKLGTPVDYDITGHSATTLSGTAHSESLGVTFQGVTSCAITGKDVLCWEFVTNDCSALATMTGYTVQFEGKPAEPVIPARLNPPCNDPKRKTPPQPGGALLPNP